MTEPRRLELAWLFGLYARVIPTPGENGDEMAFAFDGATFTPGEFLVDSGSRTVDIELTLDGNAITSGTILAYLLGVSDTNFDDSTVFWAATGGAHDDIYFDNAGAVANFGLQGNSLYYPRFIFFVATDGHCKVTVTLGNSTVAAGNIYLVVPLPSGALDISDAISIPGYIEP